MDFHVCTECKTHNVMMKYVVNIILLTFFSFSTAWSSYILIPMKAENQKNHLKAYGITYWVIDQGEEAYWLLNYEGGAFAFPHNTVFEQECKIRDVSYKVIPNAQFAAICTGLVASKALLLAHTGITGPPSTSTSEASCTPSCRHVLI